MAIVRINITRKELDMLWEAANNEAKSDEDSGDWERLAEKLYYKMSRKEVPEHEKVMTYRNEIISICNDRDKTPNGDFQGAIEAQCMKMLRE